MSRGLSIFVGAAALAYGCAAASAARKPADDTPAPTEEPSEPSEPDAPPAPDPPPFLPDGCPPGEHEVRAWNRIDLSAAAIDQRYSIGESRCRWGVSLRDSKVIATSYVEPQVTVPPGFVLPNTWGPPRVVVRADSGILFGFNKGEWGGILLGYSADGRSAQKLLDDNIVGILRTSNKWIVLAGLSHLGSDDGSVTELFEVGGKFRVGRSVELGTAPRAMVAEADGAVLIAATRGLLRLTPDLRVEQVFMNRWVSFAPTSVVVDQEGTAYVGMRGIVAEVRRATVPAIGTYLSPIPVPVWTP